MIHTIVVDSIVEKSTVLHCSKMHERTTSLLKSMDVPFGIIYGTIKR